MSRADIQEAVVRGHGRLALDITRWVSGGGMKATARTCILISFAMFVIDVVSDWSVVDILVAPLLAWFFHRRVWWLAAQMSETDGDVIDPTRGVLLSLVRSRWAILVFAIYVFALFPLSWHSLRQFVDVAAFGALIEGGIGGPSLFARAKAALRPSPRLAAQPT